MKNIILIMAVVLVFAFGFYLMKCLDNFLNENYKNIQTEINAKVPSYVMLTSDLTDDELMEEIRHFRNCHKDMRIYLCDDTVADLTEYINPR